MATSPIDAVIQRLRAAFGQDGAEMTDGELLTLFLESRDDGALAALVRRHADMVWGVCHRLLRAHHDAEDAFQATFLVLVRKANSVMPREAVGNWLYGVAYQTAVRLRAMAAKRGGREKMGMDMPEPVVQEASGSSDLLPMLDRELTCLPEKYRILIVLCHLESKTIKDVARQLRMPEGTVASRLARARDMLAKRFARRGVTVSGATLAASLTPTTASASAPTTVLASTIKAASLMATGQAVSAGLISTKVVALTDGVVKAMFVSKIKSVLAVVLVAGVVLGGLGVVGQGLFHPRTDPLGGLVHAVPIPAKEELVPAKPQVFTGTVKKPLQDALKVAPVIGRNGVLVIRSDARWDEINMRAPDLRPDKPLPKIDFAKQSVVLIYSLGSSSNNALALDKSDLAANPPELGFTFRWYNGPRAGEEYPSIKFIHAIIPAMPVVKIGVTSQPTEADRSPTVTELVALLGKDGGDIVDGLQATIAAKTAAIQPGEDILIDFALKLADPGKATPKHFGNTTESVYVWDGKYSNGYRNHGFFVTTPDGKTKLLRPEVINEWRKNIPHPVAVTAKQSYHLPNWVEGDKLKSLKTLGLDTTTPGTYTITGLYEETAEEAENFVKGGKTSMWGGSIASNTVTVEVKKGAESK